MLESRRALDALVAAEVAAGTPAHWIMLAGFSQGGACARVYCGDAHS
jgi:predicted esterase